MRGELSFAVIGAGILARCEHIPNLLRTKGANLRVCCDVDDHALNECQRIVPGVEVSKDYLKVINDPKVDALVVATTENFRIPILEAAAKAKKAVYSEKPLARTFQESLRIQRLVEDSGIPFCLGHNRRCSPAMVDGQRIFARHMKSPEPCAWRYNRDGDERVSFGDKEALAGMSIRINDDCLSWKGVHFQDENRDHGLLLAENTHFVDLACWFLQAEPLEVTTTFAGVPLHSVAIKFAGGHLANITTCANGSFGYPKELYEAMGNGGVVVVDHMVEVRTAGIAGAPLIQTYPFLGDRHPQVGTEGGLHGWLKKKAAACREAADSGNPLAQFTAEPDKGHARMLTEFVKEICGEREPVSPVQDGVRAVRVCLAAIKSMREARTVSLGEIEQ